MSFENAKMLWIAAILVPLLSIFLWGTWRKRQTLIRQFVQNKTLLQMSLGISQGRQKIRRVLVVMAVLFLFLTIARPQWGFTWEEAAQRGRDIVVAIDTSRSMLAEDVQPNRLTRARLAALDLMKLGKYDRFGLVAFAGTAFLQCPLTFDEEAFRQSIQILEPGVLPQGGTAISAAIDSAREAFANDADENHKIIVLFTDGEDHEQGVMDTVQRAADAGVKIFTIGAGTPAGEVLRVRDEKGNLVFIKDDAGNVVKSRLNEDLLRQIATTANGFYLPLNAANVMDVLYQKGLAPMPTSERSTKLMKRLKEQFYWPLSFAILLLIIDVLLPEQKRAPRRKPDSVPAVGAALATLLFALLVPAALATPGSAQRQYENREYKGALNEYQKLIAKKPNDPRLRYNAGAAAYQANKFDEALNQFQAAAASPDLDLQQQSFYNLGNTEYKLGESNSDVKEKMASWENAIKHYETALRLNSTDEDAAYNRDLVKKKLEELKKQQQDQKKDQNQDPDQKNDDKENQENKQDQQNKKDQGQNNQQQDQKDKSQEQKDQSQKNQQQQDQKDQQQQQQQQQAKQDNKDEEKKADQAQSQKQRGEKQSEQPQPDQGEEGQYAQLGKMTPAQARQLLDAQRGEEKALLFIPQERKSAPKDRIFKDW